MSKVMLTVIMFAMGVALVIGVIVPLADHARGTGQRAYLQGSQVKDELVDILR